MCNELWIDIEPQPLHNGMIQSSDVTQDFSPAEDVKIEVNLGDQNALMMVHYGHPLHMKWFKSLIYAQH
jgi:hypothetical protein